MNIKYKFEIKIDMTLITIAILNCVFHVQINSNYDNESKKILIHLLIFFYLFSISSLLTRKIIDLIALKIVLNLYHISTMNLLYYMTFSYNLFNFYYH